jgi:hypothetical protein
MRNINCRNARREIEEAAPGELLSSGVKNHMLTCAVCEKLFREQTKLQALISGLGTVEAPGDFDFRLRARLAAEKHAVAGPFAPGYFSFGFRSAVVATILLLVGAAALMFATFKLRSDRPVGMATTTPKSGAVSPVDSTKAVSIPGSEVAGRPEKRPGVVDASVESPAKSGLKHGAGLKQTVAVLGETNRLKSRDSSSTPAEVLKHDQLADAYQAAAFPIDAGYQSLKVSVDDGRGTSRTISLPTVSFGSQRALSQSPSPLIASARDSW